ncbi:hypothetical protein [Hoylesella enoeca]|uniref:Fimbrillin family protein n=1 Tax=Hoylesella enoeca TaxID=76123 RepID=A0A0S2KHQ9_9BACT|nr:hypothetical protein [Hoylesella enoeca]ALO47832.1 hypothetical protein AS203_00875 [Hoylesella enoeca]
MKTNILSLLALAGLITFAGCASDDTANKQTEQEPGTEGLTSFVEEDQATRTTGEYDGSGLNFFWTAGDRLWVNTGTAISPILTQDSKNNISDLLLPNPAIPTGVKRAAKAKFYFSGTFTASSYPVRYTGKNGTADKVTIKAAQSQSIPNDASHIGEDGDCGVATATKPVGGDKYHFTLDHKAAYATFLPFNSPGEIKGAQITKIKVSANEAMAGTYTINDAGTLTSPSSTSTSIALTLLNNFSIPKASTAAINAATMVIAPGTYTNFTVEYTLHDPATYVTGTITKTYPSVTFTAGKNKKVKTDLQVTVYGQDSYYMWDAAEGQHYWYGHLDSDGKPDGNYAQNNTDSRWHREDASVPAPAANRSAKDCPNANELIWYCMQGDPHRDDQTLWATMGHLYQGGIWFKKKDKISGFTDANYNGTDYRIIYQNFSNISITPGKPSNLNDYFYLPKLGLYGFGTLNDVGFTGYYWSSTPFPWNVHNAYILYLFNGNIDVGSNTRFNGCQLWTAQ